MQLPSPYNIPSSTQYLVLLPSNLLIMTDRLLAHSHILDICQARLAVVTTNVLYILKRDGWHKAS